MKKVIILFSFVLTFCIGGLAQYTPLPALDENVYANLITELRSEARLQNIPELNDMADHMSYNEARRFMANPNVYMDQLKTKEAGQPDKPAMSKAVFGVIAAILLNSLTGLDDYSSGQSKIGMALGFYALWTLAKVYVITELLYQYSIFGEKGSGSSYDWSQTYKMSLITLFATCVYAIEFQTFKLLLGGGFTLGGVLSGKEIYKDNSIEETDKFEFGSDSWHRFYAGVNIVAGIMLANNLMMYLSYTFPLVKLHGDWDARLSFFRLAFGIPILRR